MRRGRTTIAAAVLAMACAAAPIAVMNSPATANELPQEQWRSLWVDAFNEGIYTPAEVTKLVANAEALNANALVVQVARRYDCFCNRAIYPRTDAAIAPAPYDPLDEVIAQAHAAGIEVHAWVNFGTMWNSATRHTSPDHVFNAHGPDAQGPDRWLNKRVDGVEVVGVNSFIDPANPAAVDYVVSAIQSIVREYDVDGINLDYIRYPDTSLGYSNWGYSEASLARFAAATGRTDVPAPTDAQFSDWRRDQITNLVRRIYLGIYEIDPELRLSNDAITYGHGPQVVGGWEKTRTFAEVLQDWKGWLDEGIMDTVIAMNYKRDWNPDQQLMYDEWSEVIADWQGERQAVNGPALYLNDVEHSVAQARQAGTPSAAGNTAAGWSGYSYANASQTAAAQGATLAIKDAERANLIRALTVADPHGSAPVFAEDVAVPDMPWKQAEGNIDGRLVLRDGTPLDQVSVTATNLLNRSQPITHLSDGSGWFGFVGLDPGVWLVQLELPDGVVGKAIDVVRVERGEISEASFKPLIQLP